MVGRRAQVGGNRRTNRHIEKIGDLSEWKKGRKRYFISDLIHTFKGKIDEKIEINHASDMVVWSLINMYNKDANMDSIIIATDDERVKTAEWLHKFRSKLVKVCMEKARMIYYEAATTVPKYMCLRAEGGRQFMNYKELEDKTQNADSETASFVVELFTSQLSQNNISSLTFLSYLHSTGISNST